MALADYTVVNIYRVPEIIKDMKKASFVPIYSEIAEKFLGGTIAAIVCV